ncbi:Membrane-bound inhibitor of C-type lysozyme [Devosia sp. YR412]|uniref:MliC family protein n=1 Tax=Devosia sp. YR412 TaxID=1881030 RepID=UPI0008C6E980|nr:MliC family protein [Devosia sp. YR412]SEQ03916.1 Membrane-bound inhibitor of C-type lysozyme [Devosia sp. YR412]
MTRALFVAAIAALLLPTAANAAQTSLQIELNAGRDFERHVMTYDCAIETPITVTYINAAPNFLALVPIAEEPEELVFVSTVAASGVRYVSGKWAWETRGSDASLYDTTLGDDVEAVLTCSEFINTP